MCLISHVFKKSTHITTVHTLHFYRKKASTLYALGRIHLQPTDPPSCSTHQGWIQEFQNGGGGLRGPGAVEFLDLRFALMPLLTYPMFLLEE